MNIHKTVIGNTQKLGVTTHCSVVKPGQGKWGRFYHRNLTDGFAETCSASGSPCCGVSGV